MLRLKQVALHIKRLAIATIVTVWMLTIGASAYATPITPLSCSGPSNQSTTYACKLYSSQDTGPVTTSDANTFPVLKQGGAGMQHLTIGKGELLTPHWHPNANETTYCLGGTGVVGIVSPDPKAGPIGASFKEYYFNPGDVVFLPQGYAHYFANTGSENFDLLLTFDNPNFDILTLADTLTNLPDNIVESVTHLPKAEVENKPVIPYKQKSAAARAKS